MTLKMMFFFNIGESASNGSMYTISKITKRSFMQQYSNISDVNLMQEEVKLKSASKFIYTAGRKIYTKHVRKLHTCKNYLCGCVSCLQFKFDECYKEKDDPPSLW